MALPRIATDEAAVPARAIPAIESSLERRGYVLGKRAIDLVLSTLLVLLLLPLMALIALAIKLDTRGPVFFVHQRIGARRRVAAGRTHWDIRPFAFYKFRSMAVGADQTRHEEYVRAFVHGRLGAGDAAPGATFKLPHDPRVTRVGRILRRTSLDELPQLFNVLKGEMSLVGPRPVPPYEVAEYQTGDMERLTALPGITGLWQVNGRGEVPFAEMMRMDREYVRRQSLWLDMQILAATIPVVLSGRGAR